MDYSTCPGSTDMNDILNGIFEFSAGFFVYLHCVQVKKDRMVKGVNFAAVVFFTIWGLWNLYYYPSLGQWWSLLGSLGIVSVKTYWV